MTASQDYPLGHTANELERLERQGAFLEELTRDLLVRAGIEPGMRVLDFGAGAGDVALLCARLVGPTGEVVALERASDALEHMRARLAARGVQNVRAVHGDEALVTSLAGSRGFDAVVGRLVLLHQRDPAATLGALARALRPGGVVAFHEVDIEAGCWSEPNLPLLSRTFGWIVGAFTRGGMPVDIGRRLRAAFEAEGLVSARVVREAPVEFGPRSGGYEFLARTVRSLLPAITRLGLATEDEIAIDSLAARLKEEATLSASHFIPCFFVGASARTVA